jgi:alpha-1,2-mannosyltransferase
LENALSDHAQEEMTLAFKRVAPIAFLGVLPLVVLALLGYDAHRLGNLGNDFRFELYPAAKMVLHGANPFPPPHADLSSGRNRIFPIPAVALVTPLTVLPPMWAAVVVTAILLVLLAATLWVMGVRDWRVYGLVFMWPPALAAVQTGNITILLGLLVAFAWRYRDRTWISGLAVGAAIALKLFLWPLLIWLLAIRRYRGAAAGAGIGVLGGFLAVLPFTSLRDYVRLESNLGDVFGRDSYNLTGLFAQGDLGPKTVALLLSYAIGLGLLVLSYSRRSLTLAIVASLVLSPIVWTHYFVLLAIPLAIRWPRLAPAWFVPLVMVVCPGTHYEVRAWHIVVALAVLASLTLAVEWGSRGEERATSMRRSSRRRLDPTADVVSPARR